MFSTFKFYQADPKIHLVKLLHHISIFTISYVCVCACVRACVCVCTDQLLYDIINLTGYDCPVEEGMFDNCSLIAGASVMAAESLINNQVEVAINWCGGWHHAKR